MRSFLGCTLWILLLGSCWGLGDYVDEIGNLEVISPVSLQGLYESSVARFGIPEHEGALAGEVVYPMKNQKGCYAFDRFHMSFRYKAGSLPAILLLDRGDCFFSLKVYNAQKAGAAAVLIMDDRIEPLIFMETPEEVSWQDYHQEKINIPSALISKSFGDKIKEALSRGELVIINLAFNYPNEVGSPPCEPVKYDLWISGNLGCRRKVEGKNVNQIKDGDHEKGSDLVSSDTEERLRRSESATKYIPGRWNPGKITNPGGWQVRIS